MSSAILRSRLARHQLASAAATVADFGTMTLLVEVGQLTPSLATLFGAALGATVNFTLNRRHTFPEARDRRATMQAFRYTLVSGTSAALNAAGMLVGTRLVSAPYVLVRAAVALLVGLGWNYPMHRSYVFQGAQEA